MKQIKIIGAIGFVDFYIPLVKGSIYDIQINKNGKRRHDTGKAY